MPPSSRFVTPTVPLQCHHGTLSGSRDPQCQNPPTRIRFFRGGEAATYCDLHQELGKRPEFAAIGEMRLDVQ